MSSSDDHDGLFENRTQEETDLGTVRDALATLVAESALKHDLRGGEAPS